MKNIPIGSMVLVYMLTFGDIDGKCYHIYHTWILWDMMTDGNYMMGNYMGHINDDY